METMVSDEEDLLAARQGFLSCPRGCGAGFPPPLGPLRPPADQEEFKILTSLSLIVPELASVHHLLCRFYLVLVVTIFYSVDLSWEVLYSVLGEEWSPCLHPTLITVLKGRSLVLRST